MAEMGQKIQQRSELMIFVALLLYLSSTFEGIYCASDSVLVPRGDDPGRDTFNLICFLHLPALQGLPATPRARLL